MDVPAHMEVQQSVAEALMGNAETEDYKWYVSNDGARAERAVIRVTVVRKQQWGGLCFNG